jgi:hypothetical protein
MSNRIVVGTALLLTLGTAVAGTFLYGQTPVTSNATSGTSAPLIDQTFDEALSVQTMESWKANAVASNYIPPKLPI